jgi:hypothetical protein
MDKSTFTKNAPGKLWEISVEDKRDWAFIPDPLPKEWNISDDVWVLLIQAREELARLDGVGRLLLSLMIYEQCKLSQPWLYLSAFFDRYKDEYIDLLFQARPKIYFASSILDIAYGD